MLGGNCGLYPFVYMYLEVVGIIIVIMIIMMELVMVMRGDYDDNLRNMIGKFGRQLLILRIETMAINSDDSYEM